MSEVVYLHLMWCQCANCGFKAKYEDLPPAKDVYERLGMGDTYSDVECPKCGALCFQCDPPPPSLSKPDSEGWWWVRCKSEHDRVWCLRIEANDGDWRICLATETFLLSDPEYDFSDVEWVKGASPWD